MATEEFAALLEGRVEALEALAHSGPWRGRADLLRTPEVSELVELIGCFEKGC